MLLTVVAVVERVCGVPPLVLNVVDVMVTFHPLPEPVASITVSGIVMATLLSKPFRVTLPTVGPASVSDKLPPVIVVEPEPPPSAKAEPAPLRASIAIRMKPMDKAIGRHLSLILNMNTPNET